MLLDRLTCPDHQHYGPFVVRSTLPRIPRECPRELKLCVAVGVTTCVVNPLSNPWVAPFPESAL